MTESAIRKKIFQIYYQHNKSFSIFLMTGIGTTIINFGVFALLLYGLHLNHIVAVSVAYIAAATYQFFANRKITFNVKGHQFVQEIMRYIGLLVFNYLISIFVVQLSVWLIDSPFIGLVLTTVITPLTGYLILRYWVFKHTAQIPIRGT